MRWLAATTPSHTYTHTHTSATAPTSHALRCRDVGHVDVVVLDSSQGDSTFQVLFSCHAAAAHPARGSLWPAGSDEVLPLRGCRRPARGGQLAAPALRRGRTPSFLSRFLPGRDGAAHQAGASRPGCHLRQRGHLLAGARQLPHGPLRACPSARRDLWSRVSPLSAACCLLRPLLSLPAAAGTSDDAGACAASAFLRPREAAAAARGGGQVGGGW